MCGSRSFVNVYVTWQLPAEKFVHHNENATRIVTSS